MRILNRLRGSWRRWRSKTGDRAETPHPQTGTSDEDSLLAVRRSLTDLIEDRRVPESVREELADEYAAIESMLERLEHGHLEIAALGRVSVGKSSLLNALLGRPAFSVSALHGATRRTGREAWRESADGHVFLVDTPGIEEVDGEHREAMAQRVAASADVLLFIVDGDLTRAEWQALKAAAAAHRPVLLVLNKADRYSGSELDTLTRHLDARVHDVLGPDRVVACAAAPAPRTVVLVDADGGEREREEPRAPDVTALVERLWTIVENDGRAIAALNAGLFAGRLSDRVAARITELRRTLARRLTHNYALAKGIAVAVNPVPAADLAGAAALDVTLIVHLGRLYGLPVTRREAGRLVLVIVGQLSAMLGAVWSVNLFASVLKAGTAGLSTALTASAQGGIGYASTWILGRVAEDYFRRGGGWGQRGPKQAVEDVLESIDRDSLLAQARAEIRRALRATE